MTTNAHRRLNDALSEAKADIVRDHLLDDGGAGATVLHRLEADEKVQYLFKHSSKGIRIERPGEGEETPYNSHQRGNRYFLVTDRRVLFVAQKEGEPETVDWSYAEVSAVEVNEGWTKNRITLHLSSGETVSFWNQDSEYHNTEVDYEAVKGYIEDAIPSGETFCPECGESLTGEEDFCSGCGTDLQTMTCPTCEQTLSGNENYCISCGREL